MLCHCNRGYPKKPVVHNITLMLRCNRVRLSMEVQHIIHANLLPCTETIAYLRQRMLNRVRSYENRSADFCVLMLHCDLFNISKR